MNHGNALINVVKFSQNVITVTYHTLHYSPSISKGNFPSFNDVLEDAGNMSRGLVRFIHYKHHPRPKGSDLERLLR